MSQFLHYVHHLWFDPISASEQLNACIVLGLPSLFVFVLIYGAWTWFWESYTEEKD